MEKSNEIVGLAKVKKDAEDMKTGSAVYRGFESKQSTLHRFNPDAPIEFVKTGKENLVQAVKTEIARDPEFRARLMQELEDLQGKPAVQKLIEEVTAPLPPVQE